MADEPTIPRPGQAFSRTAVRAVRCPARIWRDERVGAGEGLLLAQAVPRTPGAAGGRRGPRRSPGGGPPPCVRPPPKVGRRPMLTTAGRAGPSAPPSRGTSRRRRRRRAESRSRAPGSRWGCRASRPRPSPAHHACRRRRTAAQQLATPPRRRRAPAPRGRALLLIGAPSWRTGRMPCDAEAQAAGPARRRSVDVAGAAAAEAEARAHHDRRAPEGVAQDAPRELRRGLVPPARGVKGRTASAVDAQARQDLRLLLERHERGGGALGREHARRDADRRSGRPRCPRWRARPPPPAATRAWCPR